jgi:proteasome accessory factor B
VRLGKRAVEGDEDAGVIRLHYTDAAVFADELAAYGPEVRVLSPASLRSAVRDRLAAVAEAHRDPIAEAG